MWLCSLNFSPTLKYLWFHDSVEKVPWIPSWASSPRYLEDDPSNDPLLVYDPALELPEEAELVQRELFPRHPQLRFLSYSHDSREGNGTDTFIHHADAGVRSFEGLQDEVPTYYNWIRAHL